MQEISTYHPDDAVNVAGHLHTILYEDEKLRVLKVSVAPGDTAKIHWHPRNINYVVSGGELEFTSKDGERKVVTLTSGQVTSAKNEMYHAVNNIGDKTVETIQVELKT